MSQAKAAKGTLLKRALSNPDELLPADYVRNLLQSKDARQPMLSPNHRAWSDIMEGVSTIENALISSNQDAEGKHYRLSAGAIKQIKDATAMIKVASRFIKNRVYSSASMDSRRSRQSDSTPGSIDSVE